MTDDATPLDVTLNAEQRGKIQRAVQSFLAGHPTNPTEREFVSIIQRYEATVAELEAENAKLEAAYDRLLARNTISPWL